MMFFQWRLKNLYEKMKNNKIIIFELKKTHDNLQEIFASFSAIHILKLPYKLKCLKYVLVLARISLSMPQMKLIFAYF